MQCAGVGREFKLEAMVGVADGGVWWRWLAGSIYPVCTSRLSDGHYMLYQGGVIGGLCQALYVFSVNVRVLA